MKAIISDVHGNLEALRAVLDDIDHLGIGDHLPWRYRGLRPPAARMPRYLQHASARLRSWAITKKAVLSGHAAKFHASAKAGARMDRKILQEDRTGIAGDARRTQEVDAVLPGAVPLRRPAVMSTVRRATRRGSTFVAARTSATKRRWKIFFGKLRRLLLLRSYAHARRLHAPGIHAPCMVRSLYDRLRREGVDSTDRSAKPRDGDPRACFITFDGTSSSGGASSTTSKRRARRFMKSRELDDFLADRLREGR